MRHPCVVCDVEHSDDNLQTLALGVALGAAFGQAKVREGMVCNPHRTKYVMAMMSVAMLIQSREMAAQATGEGRGDE